MEVIEGLQQTVMHRHMLDSVNVEVSIGRPERIASAERVLKGRSVQREPSLNISKMLPSYGFFQSFVCAKHSSRVCLTAISDMIISFLYIFFNASNGLHNQLNPHDQRASSAPPAQPGGPAGRPTTVGPCQPPQVCRSPAERRPLLHSVFNFILCLMLYLISKQESCQLRNRAVSTFFLTPAQIFVAEQESLLRRGNVTVSVRPKRAAERGKISLSAITFSSPNSQK